MENSSSLWSQLSENERNWLRKMGFDNYSRAIGTLPTETQYAEFEDGTVLCQRHFNDKFPNAWNTMVVNRQAWGDLFRFDLVKHTGTDTLQYCTSCRAAMQLPNNEDIEQWTQAWAKVAQLIGMTVAIWVLKGGSTGRAGLDTMPANKPYTTFNLFDTQASFEKELRHQCYMILGHYHIKVSENDTKKWVRHLISTTYDIFNAANNFM